MPDVYNAIRPGYPFSQDFDTDEGAVPGGAQLWLNLRAVVMPRRAAVLTGLFLDRVSATRFRLALTAGQTSFLPVGLLEGDFVQRLGGVDTPLGVRVTLPVSAVI